MNQYLLAFITGVTTGGLSCMAVQGGLLASSLARQIEHDLTPVKGRKGAATQARPQTALPIALFLLAKLIAYTLLGALLGALGSLLQLTPTMRAVLLIAIGIFMVGNALRMFNMHPIFRYFSFEPPKFITRYIRQRAKDDSWLSPVFLGALTVLIPCGIAQTVMAGALATGSAMQGAGILFAFTLGTSPVFFFVAWMTTQIGAMLEKWFMRFVAAAVLILGLVTINSGLNLNGTPLFAPAPPSSADQATGGSASASMAGDNTLTLHAANDGYFPAAMLAPANTPVTLNLVTENTRSCSRAFIIPSLGVEQLLPMTGTVQVQIPPQPAGTEMQFTCSMGMYTGVIEFK
jgi:sulfite exporter TauE/SafE